MELVFGPENKVSNSMPAHPKGHVVYLEYYTLTLKGVIAYLQEKNKKFLILNKYWILYMEIPLVLAIPVQVGRQADPRSTGVKCRHYHESGCLESLFYLQDLKLRPQEF